MSANFDDHIITTRTVTTETGHLAPPGTHGFIIRVLDERPTRYVAELSIPEPTAGDDTQLAILQSTDFEVT